MYRVHKLMVVPQMSCDVHCHDLEVFYSHQINPEMENDYSVLLLLIFIASVQEQC